MAYVKSTRKGGSAERPSLFLFPKDITSQLPQSPDLEKVRGFQSLCHGHQGDPIGLSATLNETLPSRQPFQKQVVLPVSPESKNTLDYTSTLISKVPFCICNCNLVQLPAPRMGQKGYLD